MCIRKDQGGQCQHQGCAVHDQPESLIGLVFYQSSIHSGRQSFLLSAGSTPVKGLTLIRKNK
jgi:hypothetical protein